GRHRRDQRQGRRDLPLHELRPDRGVPRGGRDGACGLTRRHRSKRRTPGLAGRFPYPVPFPAMDPRMSNPIPPLSGAGRLFSIVALIEAFTWAGLLVGMYLKYVSGSTELGVWLFGRLHGGAFLLYLVVAIGAGAR